MQAQQRHLPPTAQSPSITLTTHQRQETIQHVELPHHRSVSRPWPRTCPAVLCSARGPSANDYCCYSQRQCPGIGEIDRRVSRACRQCCHNRHYRRVRREISPARDRATSARRCPGCPDQQRRSNAFLGRDHGSRQQRTVAGRLSDQRRQRAGNDIGPPTPVEARKHQEGH